MSTSTIYRKANLTLAEDWESYYSVETYTKFKEIKQKEDPEKYIF